MTLQQLFYFCAIAEHQSYTKAAKEMNVTQSTLSHAINELEKELNAPLFNRSGKTVTLSPYGHVLLSHAQPALALLDNATAKLRDITSPESGTISIGNLSSVNELVTYAVSNYYLETGTYFSHFRFFVSTNHELDSLLESGGCDLALTMLSDNPRLEFYPIGTYETVIAVPSQHPLARYDAVHLRQLRNERLITYERNTHIRSYINDVFKKAGFEPRVVFETVNDNIILSAVASNIGVALLPKPLVSAAGQYKIVRILDDIPARMVALAWNKNRYLPMAAEKFAKYIMRNSATYAAYLMGSEYLGQTDVPAVQD